MHTPYLVSTVLFTKTLIIGLFGFSLSEPHMVVELHQAREYFLVSATAFYVHWNLYNVDSIGAI